MKRRGTKAGAAAVGHKIGFGNTEEEARIANLGCKARARPGDGPFDHNKSGRRWRGMVWPSFALLLKSVCLSASHHTSGRQTLGQRLLTLLRRRPRARLHTLAVCLPSSDSAAMAIESGHCK